MSPMLVYFLMMADSIKCMFGFGTIVVAVVLVIAWLGRAISASVVYESDIREQTRDFRIWQGWVGLTRRGALYAVLIVSACVSTFMPGTRTVAAMVVLPKLTSPAALDAMGNEAKELYGLAKDALRNLASDDKPAKSDK